MSAEQEERLPEDEVDTAATVEDETTSEHETTAEEEAPLSELELAQELTDDAARMLAPSYRGAGTGPAPRHPRDVTVPRPPPQ